MHHFPSLSNSSTNGASHLLERNEAEDQEEDQETDRDIPTTPNGRLVKLARLDEDSTQYAISLLRPAGGDELKTVKYKNLVCTVPNSISQVLDVEYKDIMNYRTTYKDHFSRLGVIPIQDPDKIAQLCDHFGYRRTGNLSLFSLQSVVFLLLGLKNSIAGDILRNDVGVPLERYSRLFDMAAIKVTSISKKEVIQVLKSPPVDAKTIALPQSTVQAFQSVSIPEKQIPKSPSSSQSGEAVDLLQIQLDWLIREREELTKEIDTKISGLRYAIEVLKTSAL